jgi:hypothetical protein
MLVPDTTGYAIASYGSNVYFGGVLEVAANGGPVTTLATGWSFASVAIATRSAKATGARGGAANSQTARQSATDTT